MIYNVRVVDRFGRAGFLRAAVLVRKQENAGVFADPSSAQRAARNYVARHPIVTCSVERAPRQNFALVHPAKRRVTP